MARTTVLLLTALLAATDAVATDAAAQDAHPARERYFRVVSSYFRVPASEVATLGDWDLPPDEISVVLFIASRTGVSPEALVALRRAGRSWVDLADRYAIGARALYLPLREGASAGVLTSAYDAFRATPVADWSSIRLTDADIVALVNVRMLAEALAVPVEEVFRHTGRASSFVDLYALLVR